MAHDHGHPDLADLGADVVKEIFMLLGVIEIAADKTMSHLRTAWFERKAVDNIPGLVGAVADRLPHSVAAEITTILSKGKTGLFDTHPCYEDRLKNVEAGFGYGKSVRCRNQFTFSARSTGS